MLVHTHHGKLVRIVSVEWVPDDWPVSRALGCHRLEGGGRGKGNLKREGKGTPGRARDGARRERALVFPGASRGASFRAAPRGLIGVQVGENKGREPIPRSR